VKIRIGYGLGVRRAVSRESLATLVDGLEERGFDSLWLSERASAPVPDPIIGLTFAAARTEHLKLGTSVQVLPGRNPALLAKELATLDVLSNGRLLPAFGLGTVAAAEQQAFGVAREERAPWFDEALPLIRRMWTEPSVDHDGPRFSYHGLVVEPKPVQHPPDVWLGGRAPSELRRIGRLGDGWLASFTTPADCEAGRALIERTAAEAGRSIDVEHYGAMIMYTHGDVPAWLAAALQTMRPDATVDDLVCIGVDAIRRRIGDYISRGVSKFVLVPLEEPEAWGGELDAVRPLLDLQR
jgi:probable F420-dependent oxidoreductase